MKYLSGAALFAAIMAGLYWTTDIWPDAEYQGYATKFEKSQEQRMAQKKQKSF
jgi:hypothetical protein